MAWSFEFLFDLRKGTDAPYSNAISLISSSSVDTITSSKILLSIAALIA